MSQDTIEPKMIHFYSQECVDLLRRALEKAQAEPLLSFHDTRNTITDSSDDEQSEKSESSASQDELKDEQRQEESSPSIDDEADKKTLNSESPKRQAKLNSKERQQEALVREMGKPPMLQLPVDDTMALHVPSALLAKHNRHYSAAACNTLFTLAHTLSESKPVVVVLLQSGRFAGGVFSLGKCVQHRTCQRYTVRKGQGKAQSSQDGSRRPKSMGAQLRRQGEVNLWQDVKETLQQWKAYLQETPLVLLACPKTMLKGLYEAAGNILDRDLVCKIPLDIGRPTYESVCAVYEIMMQSVVDKVTVTSEAEEIVEEATRQDASDTVLSGNEKQNEKAEPVVKEFPSLTPLHMFANEGNLDALKELLESDAGACAELMNFGAGPDFMTPLHYAADSATKDVDPTIAAAVVSLLLLQGKANPCIVDKRQRVAYFLASHDKVREAFRRARADLGEDCWNWNDAKVGSALTEEDVASKKEKAAEKKRRQRARQKEKKAREKAEAEAMQQRQKEEEEKQKQAEDAKRIRDGLAPKKSSATNVCDYCQTVCKGKRRNQMYQRLDYRYCSSECVQKHKRELVAQAALFRLR